MRLADRDEFVDDRPERVLVADRRLGPAGELARALAARPCCGDACRRAARRRSGSRRGRRASGRPRSATARIRPRAPAACSGSARRRRGRDARGARPPSPSSCASRKNSSSRRSAPCPSAREYRAPPSSPRAASGRPTDAPDRGRSTSVRSRFRLASHSRMRCQRDEAAVVRPFAHRKARLGRDQHAGLCGSASPRRSSPPRRPAE